MLAIETMVERHLDGECRLADSLIADRFDEAQQQCTAADARGVITAGSHAVLQGQQVLGFRVLLPTDGLAALDDRFAATLRIELLGLLQAMRGKGAAAQWLALWKPVQEVRKKLRWLMSSCPDAVHHLLRTTDSNPGCLKLTAVDGLV
jgi:hypothetical protein